MKLTLEASIMTIGGAHHQALVRILMNALSTETHAYAPET
jgi:hypothetical protein